MAAQTEKIQSNFGLILKATAVLVLMQAVFFAVWIWRESGVKGEIILVRAIPVDPRDILRGQYFQLAYDFENPSRYEEGWPDLDKLTPGATIYAALQKKPDSELYEPVFFSNSLERLPAATQVIIQGVVRRASAGKVFDFGINRFFVPEGSPEPPWQNEKTVELVVPDSMQPRILRLLIDGKTWLPKATSEN